MELCDQDSFLVLACDGLTDVVSNEDCVLYLGKCLQKGMTLQQSTDSIVKEATEGRKSRDNVSVILVRFAHRRGGGKKMFGSQLKDPLNGKTPFSTQLLR